MGLHNRKDVLHQVFTGIHEMPYIQISIFCCARCDLFIKASINVIVYLITTAVCCLSVSLAISRLFNVFEGTRKKKRTILNKSMHLKLSNGVNTTQNNVIFIEKIVFSLTDSCICHDFAWSTRQGIHSPSHLRMITLPVVNKQSYWFPAYKGL